MSFETTPPPPSSGPGRIIISIVPSGNGISGELGLWRPELDGNMDFVMCGNHSWIQAVTIDNLMQELATNGSDGMNSSGLNLGRNMMKSSLIIMSAMVLWFVFQLVFCELSYSSNGALVLFWCLAVVGFGGILLIAFYAFTSMYCVWKRTVQVARAIDCALVELAASWNRRPENCLFELTFRSGRSYPIYFELSPACGRPEPTQALHFGALEETVSVSAHPTS